MNFLWFFGPGALRIDPRFFLNRFQKMKTVLFFKTSFKKSKPVSIFKTSLKTQKPIFKNEIGYHILKPVFKINNLFLETGFY